MSKVTELERQQRREADRETSRAAVGRYRVGEVESPFRPNTNRTDSFRSGRVNLHVDPKESSVPVGTHLKPAGISAEDAPAYWRLGILWNISLSAETTAGQFTMMDQTMPRDSGAPPHIHERYDEGFFILDGSITYIVGEGEERETIVAEPGGAVWIPRGTTHEFVVTSETSRALNFYTPGGFDESVSLLATRATERTLPPPGTHEADLHGFQTEPDRRETYLSRVGALHSQIRAPAAK